MAQKFTTTILQAGKTATGIVVPPEVVETLGAGKRPPVKVKINGYTYRSSIAVMGGDFMVGVSAEVREKAGVAGGDTLEITLELDTEPREVSIPIDLNDAFEREPEAKRFFERQSYSNQRRHVLSIEGAKTTETRERRVAKAIEMFKEGKV